MMRPSTRALKGLIREFTTAEIQSLIWESDSGWRQFVWNPKQGLVVSCIPAKDTRIEIWGTRSGTRYLLDLIKGKDFALEGGAIVWVPDQDTPVNERVEGLYIEVAGAGRVRVRNLDAMPDDGLDTLWDRYYPDGTSNRFTFH